MIQWEELPHLLQEQLFALDQPDRARRWYCRGCYVDRWVEAGRPQPAAGRTA